MAVAFFDLDKTIIRKNSGTLWFRREMRLGRLSKGDTARATWGLLKYSLGFVDLEAMLSVAISRLEGQNERELQAEVEQFYRDEVHDLYRTEARRAIEAHRAKGDRVVLLTSASIYLSRCVQATLGLDSVRCNAFETRDGIFTGQPLGAICYGEGKITHAIEELQGLSESWQDAYFYTDSYSDKPVLERVGHPRVVTPDPRLSRFARRQGWEILDWT